ncbi:MAG: OmpH family outer membrane protein [Cyclobacteriaceae bacterium]|nr:OmpH family outer membrane protein [Cyclobacteriaceae bacterium]
MKTGLITILLVVCSTFTWAQKFGYVDTDYVLSKMPEYQKAQQELEKLSGEWEEEIQNMIIEIEDMHAALKAEEVLLTEEMKAEREEIIAEKETELKDYQKEMFGYEGLLFLKKQELLKPILDKIGEAITKVARENRLSIMFDKAADLVMLYTDPRFDYTDFVLDELGLGDPSDVLK